MVDLSSCYFCGAAMDVSLREHAVVPAAFSPTPDRQTTVVLCGTCERKLERVLDPVVDAAAAQRRTAAKDAPGSEAAARGDATPVENGASAGDDATGDDATGRGAGDDAAPSVPADVLSGVGDDGSEDADDADAGAANADEDTSSTTGDGTPFEVDDTASVFDDGADETRSDSVFADETDVPTTTIPDAEADGDDSDGIAFDDQPTDGTPDEAGDATDQRRERPNATGSDDAGATDTSATSGSESTASTGSDSGGEPDAPDVDPRTYNKVVRLLKNRDLPVARTEIESIAGSAYDIPDHECEAIVDAAIQRGLVAEDGSELTYPDGV